MTIRVQNLCDFFLKDIHLLSLKYLARSLLEIKQRINTLLYPFALKIESIKNLALVGNFIQNLVLSDDKKLDGIMSRILGQIW